MPTYLFKCWKGHSFEVFAPMAEAPRTVPCEACGEDSRRDYAAEHPTSLVGFVDGETMGFYPKEAGPLNGDKRHPRRVVKNKAAWREACKRNNWTDLS